MEKEKKAIRLLGLLQQTQQKSRPAGVPVNPNDVSNVLDISMASNNSTKSMDVSYGDNAGTLDDQSTEQQPRHPRHDYAFADLAELRRTVLIYIIHCFMTMVSSIFPREN